MKHDCLIFLCVTLLCVHQLNALKKHKNVDATIAPIIKDPERNQKCRTNTDCGSFGYICARNKTCQCAKNYIVDYKVKLCLGGIDQKCRYDEHCIKNAYCMNQESCQCKDKWPIESRDGFQCSNGTTKKQSSIAKIIILLFFVNHVYLL